MPGILLKLDREHDAYAIFSTVVDGFTTYSMTREEMFKHLRNESSQPDELIEARIVRADLCGSSMKDGEYGWDDGPVLFLDGGACNEMVPRDQLYDRIKAEEIRDAR
jgi:hypothetical protein